MTIERIVEIPANRRLVLDLPPDIPAGKTTITINFPESQKTGQSDFERHFDEIYGSFKNRDVFQGDPVALIRKIRDEW
jgi:hypothetical protein